MELERLVRKRGSVKAKLTIFEKYVVNLESIYTNYIIDDQSVFFELEQRVERFHNLLDEYDDIQGQIELLFEPVEAQYIEREAFEKAFYGSIARSKRFLAQNNTSPVNSLGASSHGNILSQNGAGSISNIQVSANNGVRLPVIEISTFDGEYNQWLEFRDTYESLIDKNTSLSEIQKYHYLRSYLGTSVLEIIASLEISSSNYENAWKLVCDRFNNSRLLIQNHIKSLFNINKISTESSSTLRKLVDSVAKHLRALKTLNEPTETWDTLIIYLITTKLDEVTLRKWEQVKASYQTPTLDNLSSFLKERADLLETLEQTKGDNKVSVNKRDRRVKTFLTGTNAGKPRGNCSFCKGEHYIQDCSEFLKLNLNDRVEKAKAKHLCLNCLRSGHLYRQCFSGPCKTCKSKHHTLLHSETDEKSKNDLNDNNRDFQQKSVNLSSRNSPINTQVLLSTVLIKVFDKNNKLHTIRALLDVGSQSSFLTNDLSNILQLTKSSINIQVSGLNETMSKCKNKCVVQVKSLINAFSMPVSCLVVPQITGSLPNFQVDRRSLKIPNDIKLADPYFDVPDKIDMLIGADCFWDVICNIDIDRQLTRFWEIEEFPNVKHFSLEEKACEQHFIETFTRDENNRFVVTIPLLDSTQKLGDSYDIAEKRLLALERKFERNRKFKDQYFRFIDEYRTLNHMSKVKNSDDLKITNYMPHHGVLKESSLTTKLRVVFDASCPSTSGYSFNDLQMTGPTIQSDIFSILLRYRKHNYVIAADVEKMYRMCKINPDQTYLQRILWRDDTSKQIDIYELQTVTYGTKSASYLAIRCLYQIGLECEIKYPDASRIIREDFYVDDLLSGSDSEENAITLANNILTILNKSGFHLRKWISNSETVLSGIKTSDKADLIDLGANENTKTLGLFWNGQKDCLFYKISTNFNKRITKRTVLSEISQVFDPLGLLSVTIILAKIILRDIWLEKLGWDSSLPQSLHTRWLQFRDELTLLNDLYIERQVTCKNATQIEIHGFSDASAHAYGACVYIKSTNNQGEVSVKLICAKSKVAPLKVQTIPRLELTAALLLARLVSKVKISLNANIKRTVYWCDSTIVLAWLRTPPSSLLVFVANRVSAIQDLSDVEQWRYVPTQDNPADYVSRGIRPSTLLSVEIYWTGPSWLKNEESFWPKFHLLEEDLPELKRVALYTQASSQDLTNNFKNYSNLTRLERAVAYCFRFINNCLKPNDMREYGPLKVEEIGKASTLLIKLMQRECFKAEISTLSKQGNVSKTSKLSRLNPFLDENGLLRVGGKLANSNFDFNKKHPIVLCSKHDFTRLLFKREHERLLHAGPQLLLSSIRERFWPLSGRNLARKVYHDCVICFKASPKPIAPIMGNLPNKRVNPAPPFFTTGVDYAGPFLIRDRQGRGFKVSKAYICLFICFVTRAVHLELVSDLTTEAFLAALRRFVSRRGRPSQIYSDNGSNFVGANQELKQLGSFLQENSETLTDSLQNDGISWSFIPPHSPHFGGLWEAGVKATKFHLKRVASNASLTFEKFYTLLTQIEAVLNSRPMCPLSFDPSDYTPLTPSHFLVGRPMTSMVDPELIHIPDNRLSHFQQVQKMQQHFWSRWSLEYVSELQQRIKWRTNYDSLKVDDLVIIKDDHLPPCNWLLGRIECLHPGKDGTSRVATIRTRKGNIRRSFAKICPLPKTY